MLQSWLFSVEASEAGQRLDQIVSARTGMSRRMAREVIKLGGVQVNSRRVKVAGRTPSIGAKIRVGLDESLGEVPSFAPEVLFEDGWILALNKPSGIPTQGTQASDRHDFLAVARRHFANQELYLVHRLDTGTSGVLLLAKTSRMAAEMGKLLRERAVKKTYLASIQEYLEPCTLEMPIGRVPNSCPARYGCSGDLVESKPAATVFYPVEPPSVPAEIGLPASNWIAAEPLTGRTHQIRVHLAHLGRPVLGDTLYGGPPSSRMWLHAWKLELPHPAKRDRIEIQAAWL
jgi:23S rRNA pseudouridine1911/1915/1917 synthase